MKFYGFYNAYGLNTTDTSGNRIGIVYEFGTKAERDAWIDDEDYYNSNVHRETICSKEARKEMIKGINNSYGYEFEPYETKYISMDELCRIYDKIMCY